MKRWQSRAGPEQSEPRPEPEPEAKRCEGGEDADDTMMMNDDDDDDDDSIVVRNCWPDADADAQNRLGLDSTRLDAKEDKATYHDFRKPEARGRPGTLQELQLLQSAGGVQGLR